MKLIPILILISLISYTKSINCNDVSPKKPQDCALSLEDQSKYTYCCYSNYTKMCVPYDDRAIIGFSWLTCYNKSHVVSRPAKTCAQIKPKKPSDCSFYATYTPSKYFKDIHKDELPKDISPYFISNYKNTGIIPSILIAHFFIQSEFAQSELFLETNNGFNMKCTLVDNKWKYSSWNSNYKYTKNDIDYRVYDYFEESIADYSAYLLDAKKDNNSIFPGIKDCKDYKKAAKIINDGEFPNDPNYEKQLTDIIEEYNLTQYDTFEEDADKESIRQCCYSGSYYSYSCKEYTNIEASYNLYKGRDSSNCKTKPRVNNNCNNIIPNKPSDCQLSEKDKENYKHCCYYNFKNSQASCMAFDEEDYNETKTFFEKQVTGGSFICDAKDSGEFLNAINLLLIMLIFIINY